MANKEEETAQLTLISAYVLFALLLGIVPAIKPEGSENEQKNPYTLCEARKAYSPFVRLSIGLINESVNTSFHVGLGRKSVFNSSDISFELSGKVYVLTHFIMAFYSYIHASIIRLKSMRKKIYNDEIKNGSEIKESSDSYPA